MYKVKNNLLPGNIQKLFFNREGEVILGLSATFKNPSVRTTLKGFCISRCGVKLWNRLSLVLKQCPSITKIKKRYKSIFLTRYENKGR